MKTDVKSSSKILDQSLSVEERVEQMMEASGVLNDLKKYHNISEADIKASLVEAVTHSDQIWTRIRKYQKFLREIFPEIDDSK